MSAGSGNSAPPRIERGRQVFLKPGELCVAERPVHVVTVLGSCVALTLFDPYSQVAAICHAVHPHCQLTASCPRHCDQRSTYVACVIPDMVEKLRSYGIDPRRLEIKLFGGASILSPPRLETRDISVGRQNIEAAQAFLRDRRLPLKVAEVGGRWGRKLIFDTATGCVWVKCLGGRQGHTALRALPKMMPQRPRTIIATGSRYAAASEPE